MEIDKELEPCRGTALGDLLCAGDIIGTAAVGDMVLRARRIIPDADADRIDACLCKRFEDILFLAAAVIESDTALLQRDHR